MGLPKILDEIPESVSFWPVFALRICGADSRPIYSPHNRSLAARANGIHVVEIGRMIDEDPSGWSSVRCFLLPGSRQAHGRLEAGRVNGRIVLEVIC